MATSNNEWLQIYQNNLTGTSQQRWFGDVTDATTVITTASNVSKSNQPAITRPTNPRRRSRSSRSTPTTLLNTDPANFRAMVQQFTGCGGSTPFIAAPAAVAPPCRPTTIYSANSSSYNYYGMGSNISPPSAEVQQLQYQQYYTTAAENGGAGGDRQRGFVREGNYKLANFSVENNTGAKDNTCMF